MTDDAGHDAKVERRQRAAFKALVRDVRACERCPRMAHTHTLSEANGPLDARLIFIAEAPGRRGAAMTGVPLTGDETGRRFTEFMRVAGLERGEAFITNAVLCNPVDELGRNRTPSWREVTACRPFLERTMAIVSAKTVVTLGRVALRSVGQIARHEALMPRDIAATVAWRDGTLVPMYHPGEQSRIRRSQRMQIDDWERLGALVRAMRRGGRARGKRLE